ncbi:MAG: DsrE/DsrF/DrsH-like family protein [Actinomycetaceae bacterium]|nr:DsrE/DsrF/DrsH-like family protein [Arcanobacterium sp.]MDD7505518.1 DsrE/DsrF/DrsH-like family protein [Actinomycetaceae bacterium]
MPTDSHGNIIPDFGDGAATSSSAPARGNGGGASTYSGPRKMAFICSKGNLDMAYPALIMANAALGEGAEVHIFFTFWGLDLIDSRTVDSLKFSYAGNTAMHFPALERFKGGLGTKSMPQVMASIPGVVAGGTAYMKRELEKLDIPPVREMIEQVNAMGGNLWACKLTMDMMHIKEANLLPEVRAVISATDFIEISEGAQIVFI